MANLITIGQLIDRSWDHYSGFFKALMKISLWAFILIPLLLIRIFLAPDGEVQSLAIILNGSGSAIAWLGVIFGAIVSIIVVPVITIWIYINLVKAIESQNKKKPVSFKELRKYGWKNFFSYLWVAILKSVITSLPLLLLVPGLILIWTNIFYNGGSLWGAASTLITLIGIIAALILIITLGVQLGFSCFERLIADKRGLTAVKGSHALVKGRFWSTLWRLLVPKIVFGIATGLLQIIVILVLLGLTYAFYAISQTTGDVGILIVSILLTTGVAVLTTPIFIIADYLLYDSLLKTK